APSSEAALHEIGQRQPSLIILDIWLQGSHLDGMQLLDHLSKSAPLLPVVMISGHGNIETAVTAVKKGAFDFIEKPFKSDRLLMVVEKALEAARLKRENQELRLKLGHEFDLIGKSQAVQEIRKTLEKVAPTGSRVLITGPAGSGKEVIARQLHKMSRRADGPFVVANCATMQPERLEVELFGTENGAASTHGRKTGLLEAAHNGTLLLDEVADMPLETQGKILRALQEQSFSRVGGSQKVQVDVRVIASTNKNLEALMAEGRFRQDLYYRLNVVPIKVVPLSQRRDDIPHLAQYFLSRAAESAGLATRILGEDALAALQAYEWPGNIRQLRNAMEWLLIMHNSDGSRGEAVRADQLPPEITASTPNVLKWERGGEIMMLPLRDAREMFEREYLLAQVTRFGGNISRTANFIGMERSALHRKLKMLGVHGSSSTPAANDPPVAAVAIN
ncbi:MAG: sigma-54-dependent Fis family transcriptional regulator, partial [Proteobacteria bacterium]|nr:sigma-54-dependent Fis family transcriptional regulator [Pseudomonadota bacterium]